MTIHIGIGGWTYEPWRGPFYPAGLAQKRELEYAGQHLTGIEINGTYYGSQKPESFANWAASVPDGFQFAIMSSSMFITWQKAIGGRLESRLRFASTLTWYTVPLPEVAPDLRAKIAKAGQGVLAAESPPDALSPVSSQQPARAHSPHRSTVAVAG